MSSRNTIARDITTNGVALHAGVNVRMTLAPAAPGAGIVFRRADLGSRDVPARYDLVSETRIGTLIERDGASVGVIEHLMAALAGAEIDDLLITLDGPEPPILDGDALGYLRLIDAAGVAVQSAPCEAIKVLQPVTVEHKDACISLLPAERLAYDFEIAFDAPAIGTQKFSFVFSPEGFRREIAPARTFGFLSELESLHKMNRARGASLENTLAIDAQGVVNASLMRYPDEFVRHKILDAIGDMALAGAPLVARIEGVKSGHATNNAVLRALFADPSNYAKISRP